MPRSLEELISRTDEYVDRLMAYEPKESDRREPPAMALRRAAYNRIVAERELAEAVTSAREAGMTWKDIGEGVGTTGEAARQRYAAA